VTPARARAGALCADSLPFSESGTLAQAQALRAAGIEAVYGYLGVINAERVGYVLQAGMAFLPVTLADRYNGPSAVTELTALGVPGSVSVCLDMEGPSTLAIPSATIAAVNAWAAPVARAGYIPSLYVGVPQPLTSEELWLLNVHGYWRGQGSIRDRNDALAEPLRCGWWGVQAYPSVTRGGVLVDLDMLTEDYLGRLPSWAVA
jgi:hypothetical protein